MGNKRQKSKRRYTKFEVTGGRHGLAGRRKKRALKNRVKNTLRTLNVKNEDVSMCVKKKNNLKFTFARLSVQRARRFVINKKEADGTKLHVNVVDAAKLPGNRIINLNSLKEHVAEISLHSALCQKAREKAENGIDPVVLTSEKRNGFETIIKCKCKGCGKEFTFNESESVASHVGELKEINVKGVWGSMVTGGGAAVMNEFMGTLGVPGMNPSQYTKTEEQIGEWWREVLQEDMKEAGREERQHAIDTGSFHQGIPSIAVVCDGGWCKRSHKHTYNATAGVGVIFGLHTKKLLHIGIRNKLCYICSAAQGRNETPREHKCFKNWNESAQSMESDIILEGFLNCEQDHGVRYMKVIADGDSSVYANIIENVAGWGPFVQKIECANHACKCLRAHLEQLVTDKPQYKGKGKLTLLNRKRIVQGVRCAIKMRSKESDIGLAKKKLNPDIKNCARHVLGLHDKCSTDFCKYSTDKKHTYGTDEQVEDRTDVDKDGDAVKNASEMWTDTMEDMTEEEEKKLRAGGTSQGTVNEDLVKDLFLILNRMANKSDRLISNFTSNLAECWMNIRCKFDGGKVTNRCFRGSFYARCYGGGLRSSRGPAWSPMVYSKVTGKRPDDVFVQTYRQRARNYLRTVKRQRKPATKLNRFKRKMDKAKDNKSKKAKRAYGPNVLLDTADLPFHEVKTQCEEYYTENVVVSEKEACALEVETRGQAVNDRWKTERRKRLTSSVFGDVMSRNANNNSPMLPKRLLYSNFGGNAFTRKGLMEEENTRKEYINLKNKDEPTISHVSVPGLSVCKSHPFLASSSDGIVHMKNGDIGLIEIKNLLQNKNTLIKEAAKTDKNFCLSTTSGSISLKRNHKYFFQIQGQLNILEKEWCDFIVRRTDPYDIFVERIYRDEELWKERMLPKLRAFYFSHLLPEIAVPRYRTISGIRKPPIPWYTQPCTTKKATNKRAKGCVKDPAVDTVSQHSEEIQQLPATPSLSPLPSTSQASPHPALHIRKEKLPTSTLKSDFQCKRSKRKQKVKFVGRRVSHRWQNEDGHEQWYSGVVVGVSCGRDGDDNAVYQIQYTDDHEIYEVEEVYKDYYEGNLCFDDL